LQTSSTKVPDQEYVPRDDESEAKRIAEFNGNEKAEILTTDDVKSYSIQDFGLGLDIDQWSRAPVVDD